MVTFQPISAGVERPFWSVMLPTYSASDLFEETLRSVLIQDPGPEVMEIVVVDDHSPNNVSEEIVAKLAPGRVQFHRNATNLGLAGNWNECIRLSRGHWLHILHQDDLILPGFYERLGCAEHAAPEAGAAFCQHVLTDLNGRWLSLSELERCSPGLLDDWLSQIVSRQRIECPSIVVKRSVYESLGGFTNELVFTLDWEMWVRIALHSRVWFEPTMLACHRRHLGSETTRLSESGRAVPDVVKAFALMKRYLPAELHGTVGREMRPRLGQQLLVASFDLLNAGDYRAGFAKVNEACRYDPAFRFSRLRFDYWRWALKLCLRDWYHQVISARTRTSVQTPSSCPAPPAGHAPRLP